MTDLDQGIRSATTDPPNGDTVLLRACRQGDGWLVGDCVTTRVGYGKTLQGALAEYCNDMEALTQLDGPFGPPVASEVDYARRLFNANTPTRELHQKANTVIDGDDFAAACHDPRVHKFLAKADRFLAKLKSQGRNH